jgi:hypothetical protein
MADIKISNLSGSDLFSDTESFMIEINEEAEYILGGKAANADDCWFTCLITNIVIR